MEKNTDKKQLQETENLSCQDCSSTKTRLAAAAAILEDLCHGEGLKYTIGSNDRDCCTLVVLADEEDCRTLEVKVTYDILDKGERLEELRGIITMTRWPDEPHFKVRGFRLPREMIESYDWR